MSNVICYGPETLAALTREMRGREVELVIDGTHWAMRFEIDEDDAGVFPIMRQYVRDGFPWSECDVRESVKDALIREAYAALKARGME